jgi:hypothetical protein
MRRLRLISPFIFLLAIAAGFFLFLTFSGRITQNSFSDSVIAAVRPYPALTSPKTVALTCSYHGQDIRIEETLYGSLDTYYRESPAKRSAYYHDQNDKYVFSYKEDKTISSLTSKIKTVASEKALSEDQTLDLAACLLQSIPYDTEKAARILSPDYFKLPMEQLIPRYPYETLYEEKGICTDKSFLGVAIFRELGYSTSLLTFDSQRHMSVGVEVTPGYGDFGTKYAIMELTGANFLVGDIPEISGTAGLAVGGIETIPNVTTDSQISADKKTGLTALTKTIPISGGSVYSRIVDRVSLRSQIAELKPKLQESQQSYKDTKAALVVAETALKSAESSYKENPTSALYAAYSSAYSTYTKAYNTAMTAVDLYNSTVNKYNALVSKYREY